MFEVINHQKWEKVKILQIFISLIMWTKMSNLISLDYNYGTLQLPTFGHGFITWLWMRYDYMIRFHPLEFYFDWFSTLVIYINYKKVEHIIF
jgi:hypothetical protein